MAIAGTLEIQMLANLARLQNDMTQAKGIVTTSMKSVEGAVKQAQQALGALGMGLSIGAVVAYGKSIIDLADNMNDLSQRVGIGIKDLATWTLAANQSGASIESVAKGVKGLSVYMTENGKKLRAAGITATDANGAMIQLADLFKAMPDGAQKTALAVQLFGKAGMDMIPMLNLGSAGLAEAQAKAKAYGDKLAELAPKADEFNDLMSELGLQSKVAGMNIADYFLPGLIGMATWLNDIANGGERGTTAMEFLTKKTSGFTNIIPQLRIMAELIGKISPYLAGGEGRAIGYTGPKDARGLPMRPGEKPAGPTLAQKKALAASNLAGKRAVGLLDKDGAAKKASLGIFGPDDVMDSIREAVAKKNRADYIAGEKEMAAAIDASNKALADQADKMGDQIAAAELALKTYGLTESQIADLTLARLRDNKARAEAQDADEATLAYYAKEIDALERIKAAKYAVEAKDVAKKEAEDATKAWKDFTRDLESSLTDALMRSFEAGDNFGEAFAKNLQNLFKTMILKAAVQITVGTVSGAAQQALGINLGGASGGIGGASNLLSTGNSIYSLASGGGMLSGFGMGAASAASELALGASFVGPSASLAGGAIGMGASAGLATGSAGAAGALSGLAAAAPYIGGALAIASAFGLFGKNKPAPIEWALIDNVPGGKYPGGNAVWDALSEEGPFSSITTVGQHLTRNGQNRAGLKSQITDPLLALDKVLAQYTSADENKKIGRALVAGNEGEHPWGEADAVMLRRLNRISDAIGGWADKLFDTTTGNLQARYSELAQILSIRGDEAIEKLAQDFFNARGKWDYKKFANLQAGVARFDDMFKTDAERFDTYSDAMHKAFDELNIAFPESRDGFKALVEGVDTSTKAGFDLYATLLDLVPTMGAYYDALKSQEDAALQAANAINFSSDSFRTLTDFIRAKSYMANGIPLSMMSAANMPSYDVGTDYVPRTGPAMIHQGERITTASDNASLARSLETISMELASIKASMQSTAANTRKSADILVQVSRDGESFLTEAA